MRFRRLSVSHFRAVDRAALSFGPGLNVLYGPNDLGKTTLATALRAVLLLPADSSAHQQFLPWHSSESPQVALAFEALGKHWRISKTFGQGSSAVTLLEHSPDGQRFHDEARGRAADGRMRELLRWGIEAPGGRSGGRGLPESFLSQVLLAAQGSVAQILERTLSADRDGSGRERLHEALQALAQDPLFLRVLKAVQEKVDSAFTPTGRKKTGQASPFAPLRQSISELTLELERVGHQRRESDEVEQRIRLLNQERLVVEAHVAELAERVSREQAALADLARQRELRERAASAELALRAQQGAEQQLRQLETQLAQAGGAAARLSQAAVAAGAARGAHEADAAQAEAQLRELTSDTTRQARAAAAAELERELARLELRARSLRRARELERELEQAGARHRTEQEALRHAEQAERERTRALEAGEAALGQARRLTLAARFRDARLALERSRAARRAAEELSERAAALSAQAAALQAGASAAAPLTPALLAELRELEGQLSVARARSEVGLRLQLGLPAGRSVTLSVDGAAEQALTATARPLVTRARSQLRARLGDGIELEATAGDPELLAKVEALAARWAALAEPHLLAAQVADLEALSQRAERAQADLEAARSARREAESLLARAAEKRELGAELELCEERAEQRRLELGEVSGELLAELDALGAGWEAALSRRVATAEREQRELQAALVSGAATLARRSAALASAEAARELALSRHRQELGELGIVLGCEASGVRLEEQLGGVEREVALAAASLAEQESRFRAQLCTAERARDALLGRLAAARAEEQGALAASRDASERELGLAAQLQERRRHVDPSALAAAQREHERAQSALAGLPELPAVTPEALARSRAELERETARLGQLLADLRRAEGALGQVGGDVVRERETQTREALERQRLLELDLERDYEAYRLLADTLRSAENEQGAHLGRALSAPVTERFARLTEGRYGSVGLDTALGLEGILVAGQLRPYRELSEGTQEQLATILRLAIAEQIETALVLDDHLAQTHRERVAWFRDALRQSAQRIQILILTARPEDYLSAEELRAADPADAASGGNDTRMIRSVDLEQVIQRARYGQS